MSESTVLVLGSDPPPKLDRLTGRARVIFTDEDSLADRLPSADVLLAWDFTSDAIRRAWPEKGPRPRWVHTASAGVDQLLCPALVADDTLVTNARGVFEQPIAEYVAGLVIAMAKDICTTLLALGVKVDLVGRRERSGDPEFGLVHASDALNGLLPQADWVVCAAPLTEATRGLFDKAAFSRMPPRARFINIGRGPLVVEDALVAALREWRIAAAALDVFEQEPLPTDSPLWDVPHLIVSPHMSGDTLGWRDALAEQFQDNFDQWSAGRPLHNLVDKRLGYVPVQ